MNEENSPTDWESNQPSTWQWVLIAGIAIVVLCGIAAFTSLAYQTYNQWGQGRNEQATQAVVTTTAVDVERMMGFREASRQPALIFDPFVDNVNEWLEEDIDDEYTTMSLTINGRYIWDATAKQGFVWRIWPQSDVVSDFYLAVDAQNLSDNLDAQYGLIFRNDGDSYYYLEVRDTQHFRVFSYIDNEWIELIPYTYTDAIYPGETNRLEIVAKDDEIYVAINGQFVGQTEGSYPSEGQVGLIIGLANENEEATIAFDNFELRPLETSK
jgi:hypothetical protein